MLSIKIPGRELFDEETQSFIQSEPYELRLEHSLVSVSKWESKWKKPFLDPSGKKTWAESLDYVRCMTLNQHVKPEVYMSIGSKEMEAINAYIEDFRTATKISTKNSSPNREIMTSEVIYCYMFLHNIPIECQKWHLSRLMTLLEVCSIKSNPGKKMSRSEILAQNKAINAARRKASHTKG